MTTPILAEARRWARALAWPALLCLALVAATVLSGRAARIPDEVRSSAVHALRVLLISAAVWLAIAIWRAARQPSRDRAAALHLREMRERAEMPGWSLVCIVDVLARSVAGQHSTAVDLATGAAEPIWLSETSVDSGSYVLLRRTATGTSLVDSLALRDVRAAHRAETLNVAATRKAEESRRRTREKAAAAALREAENAREQGHEEVPGRVV